MANVTITDLVNYPSITAPTADVLPIVDTTNNTTKKVTVSTLLSGITGTGTVTSVSFNPALSQAFTVGTPTTTPQIGIVAGAPTGSFLSATGAWLVPPGSGTVTNFSVGAPASSALGVTNPTNTPTLNFINVGGSASTVFLRGDGQWAVPAGSGGGGSVNSVSFSGSAASAFAVTSPTTTPTISFANVGSPSNTLFLRGDGVWAAPSSAAGGTVTSFGLSSALQNSFTVANPTTTPTLSITGATSVATQFLRADGNWAVPAGGGGGSANTSAGLNIYSSSIAGTALMGIDLTTGPATVTITAPATVGENLIWTLSAALPSGYNTGDLVIFATSGNAIVGIGTYTVTAAPSFTIAGVIYDSNTSSPTASTVYPNVTVRRGVPINAGGGGTAGIWLAGTTPPTAGIGSVGQYYSQTNTDPTTPGYLSYVKTSNTVWTLQPNLDQYVGSQAAQLLYNNGLAFASPAVQNPVYGVKISSTNNVNGSPSIVAVDLTGATTSNVNLVLNGQNNGGIILGGTDATCPLYAASSTNSGIQNLTPGIAPNSNGAQTLYSAGPNKTPYWGDAPGYDNVLNSGQGYTWTWQFTLRSGQATQGVGFRSLPYITTYASIATGPQSFPAPAGGFTSFLQFANTLMTFINSLSQALQLTYTVDTLNLLITITSDVPTGALLNPNPPTSASLLPIVDSQVAGYITGVSVATAPTAAALAAKVWTFDPFFVSSLENRIQQDFGQDNYAYLIMQTPTFPALTTTLEWIANAGSNILTFTGTFTALSAGVEFNFVGAQGTDTRYNVYKVDFITDQNITYTKVTIWTTFTRTYRSGQDNIYQILGNYYADYLPNSAPIRLPWSMDRSSLDHLTYRGATGDQNTSFTFQNISPQLRRYSITYWYNFVVTNNYSGYVMSYLTVYNTNVDINAYNTAPVIRGGVNNDNFNWVVTGSWNIALAPGGVFNHRLVSNCRATIGNTPTFLNTTYLAGGVMSILEV